MEEGINNNTGRGSKRRRRRRRWRKRTSCGGRGDERRRPGTGSLRLCGRERWWTGGEEGMPLPVTWHHWTSRPLCSLLIFGSSRASFSSLTFYLSPSPSRLTRGITNRLRTRETDAGWTAGCFSTFVNEFVAQRDLRPIISKAGCTCDPANHRPRNIVR